MSPATWVYGANRVTLSSTSNTKEEEVLFFRPPLVQGGGVCRYKLNSFITTRRQLSADCLSWKHGKFSADKTWGPADRRADL